MRWANTTYEKVEVVDDSPPAPCTDCVRLRNVETGQFLTTAGGSAEPVTMSDSADDVTTHWRLVESGAYHNIDSYSETGGTGILRAPGAGGPGGAYVVLSTLKAPPAADTDKTWTIHYDATTDTYRFESRTAGRFLYHNADGTVTHSEAPATDNRSVWKSIPADEILSTDNIEADFASLTIYPNPVRQNEYLTIESESQPAYQIFNLQGMLVKSGTEKTIKMDLEKGIYFLRQNNSSQVERFIVH